MANLLIPYENSIIFSQYIEKYNSKFVMQVHLANPLDCEYVMVDRVSPQQSDLDKNLSQGVFFLFL